MFKQLPEYERLGALEQGFSAVSATTADEVYNAVAQGYSPENIFFLPHAASDLSFLPPHCRPVASNLEQLQQMDFLARQSGGALRSVGLRLVPEGYSSGTGIAGVSLPKVAKLLPALTAITVRGCFITGDLRGLHGKLLGRFFRDCYENAKRMSVILPCAMPYLCVEGAMSALEHNRCEHPQTLTEAVTAAQIVAMQNQTAFYARLMIS